MTCVTSGGIPDLAYYGYSCVVSDAVEVRDRAAYSSLVVILLYCDLLCVVGVDCSCTSESVAVG